MNVKTLLRELGQAQRTPTLTDEQVEILLEADAGDIYQALLLSQPTNAQAEKLLARAAERK